MAKISKEFVDAVRDLKLVFTDKPQPELLIRIPNDNRDISYAVVIETSEFSSLCPLNAYQPDYATIKISYSPKEHLVELKSLKFYLTSYRMCLVFHEQVPSMILSSLKKLLVPDWIKVEGVFTIRGGIKTTVIATSWEEKGE